MKDSIKERYHLWLEIFAAIVPPLVAVGFQVTFWEIFRPYVWFIFYPAIFVSSWIGALRSGLIATILSTGLAWWFLVPPVHSFTKEPKEILPAIVFFSMGIVISVFQERWKDANQQVAAKRAALERARERERAAQVLRESEEKLRLFFENAPAALAMFDRQMRYLAVSHRWLKDYFLEGQDIINRSHYEIFPEVSDTWKAIYQRAQAGEVIRAEEDRFERADGAVQWVRWEARPWRNSDDEIGGIVIFTEDITELKKAEKTRLESKELKQFFANVSHELRTPLTLILGPVESLLSKASTSEIKPTLELIQRNARGLLKQVNDLLDVARLEAGKSDVVYTMIDLAKLVRQVVANFQAVIQERRVKLCVETPDLLPAQIDIDKIEHVVVNLVSNALKFTPEGGVVRCALRAVPGKQRAIIEVADSGAGIPEQYRESVFNRFFKIEEPSIPRLGGTGLGLSIVKDFVELQGGTVKVGNAPEGGALFTVEFPIVAPPGVPVSHHPMETFHRPPLLIAEPVPLIRHRWKQVAPTKPPQGVYREQLRKPIVLVVEDTPDMLDYVCENLGADLQIETATNGREGLEKARSLRPDLIISDIMMPEMTGDQMFHELRSDSELAMIPVILLTAKADQDLRIELLRSGAQDYLIKPFITEELQAKVRNILAVKAAEAKYRGLLESAQDAIVIVGSDGKIRFMNQQTISYFGYTKEELIGQTIEILVPERLRSLHFAHRDSYLSEPVSKQMAERYPDLCGRRKDGSEFPVSIALSPLLTFEGLLITAIVRDISEMKKLSEQAIRAREEAIASVSHDLKNPLSAILMTIQLLTSKRLSSEQQETVFENSIKTIKIASNQMKNLIGDLLDYTKLESGRLKIEKKEEDVSSILTEVVGIFEPIAKSRRLDLFSENAAGIAKVTCERKRIIRVLSNLINNAIKFTPSGGRVTISAELKNGEALFVVRDTGTGITSEQLPHIFERYWQADETARKGTGLGLAIAKGFVEVHNGKIWVESQPGYGSTFFFTIPLAEKLEKIA